MSKAKSKASKGAAPAQDVLTKVKDAAINKPAQTVKAKSKELAKQVVGNQERKKKSKKVKEPTPESSDAESEDESDESESSEGSDSEEQVEKPVKNGKLNATTTVDPKSTKKTDSDDGDSEADSDELESSENEAPVNGVQTKAPTVQQVDAEPSDEDEEEGSDEDSDVGVPASKAVKAAKAVKAVKATESSDEEDEDEDEDDSDDESDESDADKAPAKNKGPVKAEELSKKLNPIAADTSSGEDSDEDSDASAADSDESEGDSSDDDEEEEEVKPAQPANAKRKAEEVAAPATKKPKKAETGADNNQGGNLFVGNLSWNVDEEWLTREFEEFGELSGVRIITDRNTGRSKG